MSMITSQKTGRKIFSKNFVVSVGITTILCYNAVVIETVTTEIITGGIQNESSSSLCKWQSWQIGRKRGHQIPSGEQE